MVSRFASVNYKADTWQTDDLVEMIINTKHRSNDVEIMDDFSINGEMLRDSLDKLGSINKWLGGNKVTIEGLKKLLLNHPKHEPITIIDLGCGGGDILRDISKFGFERGYQFNLIGIDANADAILYARELSISYSNVSFLQCDIFSDEFKELKYDIVLATLFFHHFKEQTLIDFLSQILKKAKMGIVVNDLHRHKMAYYLFKIICLGITNKMITEDGLTSVLRGFKHSELVTKASKLKVKPQIKWKWAFRYQWIIQKH